MVSLLSKMLLREIPSHLMAGINAGDYQVFGSVIKSTSTGHILGHLQETSALTSVLANLVPGLSSAVELGGQAVTIIQNEQIKSAISFVQTLQYANLALGVASIGVSVAGTSLLKAQIQRVEGKVDALLPELHAIAKGVEQLRHERIAEDFTRLKVLVGQVDECWLLANSNSEWRAIARDADFLAGSFAQRAQEVAGRSVAKAVSAESFIDAYALASSLRITARMASDDTEAAYRAACERVQTLIELDASASVAVAALEFATAPRENLGDPEWLEALDREIEPVASTVKRAQIRLQSSAATAETLAAISNFEISGREWLDTARSESEVPTLFLPADLSE